MLHSESSKLVQLNIEIPHDLKARLKANAAYESIPFKVYLIRVLHREAAVPHTSPLLLAKGEKV